MRNRSAQLLSSIFNTDNWLMRVCEKILDLVTVNLLFLLSCLPIVTIGIAKISLYRTVRDIRANRGVRVVHTYSISFKREWRQGLVLGSMELLVSAICLVNLLLLRGQTALMFQGMKIAALGLFFLLLMVMLYTYPLVAQYEQSLQGHLQTAFVIAGLNFLWTFGMIGFFGLLVFLLLGSSWTIVFGGMFFLLIGFSSLAYAQWIILEPIFRKYDGLK